MASERSVAQVLATAEQRMWTDFQDAQAFENSTDKGDVREAALSNFLSEKLPTRYRVARGEVVDASGALSRQTDILIYDESLTAPLLTKEPGVVILPVEALLATVEVKSTIDGKETSKAIRGIRSVRELRPFGHPWGFSRDAGKPASDGLPNFFSSIFAYKTTYAEQDWRKSELERLRKLCIEEATPTQWIDRLVVLSRGVVLPSAGKVATFDLDQQVLGLWFFHLVNFLTRESARRQSFPWALYERSLNTQWKAEFGQLNDAPLPKKASQRQRRRYLNGQ